VPAQQISNTSSSRMVTVKNTIGLGAPIPTPILTEDGNSDPASPSPFSMSPSEIEPFLQNAVQKKITWQTKRCQAPVPFLIIVNYNPKQIEHSKKPAAVNEKLPK
jgi:hypothetical protein